MLIMHWDRFLTRLWLWAPSLLGLYSSVFAKILPSQFSKNLPHFWYLIKFIIFHLWCICLWPASSKSPVKLVKQESLYLCWLLRVIFHPLIPLTLFIGYKFLAIFTVLRIEPNFPSIVIVMTPMTISSNKVVFTILTSIRIDFSLTICKTKWTNILQKTNAWCYKIIYE